MSFSLVQLVRDSQSDITIAADCMILNAEQAF